MQLFCRPIHLLAAAIFLGAPMLDAAMVTAPRLGGVAGAWRFDEGTAVVVAPLDRTESFVPRCDITGATAAWGSSYGALDGMREIGLPGASLEAKLEMLPEEFRNVVGSVWESLTLGDSKKLPEGMVHIMAYDRL
jgi:hypothetical protein